MTSPYDELYKQFDMLKTPFGYRLDYFLWRTSKTKGEIAKFIRREGLILDVGGGFGVMAQFLPQFVSKDKYYINLDISITMLKYSPYQNILAAAENLPFRSNVFDYVICSEVLEHVRDKRKVLSEAYRVLKLKGLFLLTTPRRGWIRDFKRSPFFIFLILDRFVNLIKDKLFKGNEEKIKYPAGVVDKPSDEEWLKQICLNLGFKVLVQYRVDNHVPWGKSGESRFWRYFSDLFVNARRFGHCTFIVCEK
jgi:ubiquinone/menaquinone biosynthesis C-methylase UbiE